MHEDASANQSDVSTSDGFTTAAPGSFAQLAVGTGSTGAGVDRRQYIDSDGFVAVMNNDIGANCWVKSPDAPPAKFHFEVSSLTWHPSNGASVVLIGVMDAALDVNSVYPTPGNGVAGFSIGIGRGANPISFYRNGGGEVVNLPTSNTVVGSDLFSFDVDTTSNTVVVKYKRGATVTTMGTWVLTSQIPTNWRAGIAGQAAGDGGTVNFGATAFAITPLTGHEGW